MWLAAGWGIDRLNLVGYAVDSLREGRAKSSGGLMTATTGSATGSEWGRVCQRKTWVFFGC